MAQSYFRKGFDAVYNARVRCPICKEEIHASALLCPFCRTDLATHPHDVRKRWQTNARRIVLAISSLVSISICINGVPVLIGIVVGLFLYGFGYVIIQKIQSIKNRFYK